MGQANREKGKPRQGGIQVISRAATILRSLENERDGLSLGEISDRVDLPRSTVQRIVSALADEQLLIAASPRARVRLGPALIRMANATSVDIEQIARPIMEEVGRKINETIDLSVVQGRSAVFVAQVLGNQRLAAISAVGDRFPLYCTACGKALMAHLPEAKVKAVIDTGLVAYTENTITSPAVLGRQLEAIRSGEIAEDNEEHAEGICALGLSFADPLERLYAISIPVPSNRFETKRESLEAALTECRDKIVEALGQLKNAD